MKCIGIFVSPIAFFDNMISTDIRWSMDMLYFRLAEKGFITIFFSNINDINILNNKVYITGFNRINQKVIISHKVECIIYKASPIEFGYSHAIWDEIEKSGILLINSYHTLKNTFYKNLFFKKFSKDIYFPPFYYIDSLKRLKKCLHSIPAQKYVIKVNLGGGQRIKTEYFNGDYFLVDTINESSITHIIEFLLMTKNLTRNGIIISEFIEPKLDEDNRARCLKLYVIDNKPYACRYDFSLPYHWLTAYHISGKSQGEKLENVPNEVFYQLKKITQKLDIKFASIDFFYTSSGYRLLEINPSLNDTMFCFNITNVNLVEIFVEQVICRLSKITI